MASMNKALLAIIAALGIFFISGCDANGKINFKRKKSFTARDKSITPENSFTDLFLDSMRLEQFITNQAIDSSTAQHMRSFYNSRNYQYAWFTKDGLSEPGLAFWNLLLSFISMSKDSSLFDKELAGHMVDFTDGDTIIRTGKNTLAKTELGLTKQFFIYAKTAYAGRIDPQELQWFIPRKKVDALALLDSLVSRKGKILEEEWEPVNPQYQALKKELIRFNDINDKGGWSTITIEDRAKYKPGDSAYEIFLVKQRLLASGDLQQLDSSGTYDSTLLAAVERTQKRFGFKTDGIIDKPLITELNVSAKQRIEQILINLERMRWLPEKPAPSRIIANIPEFKIHVYENNQEQFDMNIVVGKEGTSTVIFNDELKYIVFSPYWNVPRSIVKNEILPAMKRNSNYLARQNMEIVKKGDIPTIRQKPGGKNSLGRVKFLFPNNYNIYFHDTPAKSLFEREKRAFSHGCMRLAEPRKLAIYLLRDQPEWTEKRIDEAMNLKEEKWVTLKQHIPVYVSYFTAWVDSDGLLNFRDDIYGHDKKMAERLFVNPSHSNASDSSAVAGK